MMKRFLSLLFVFSLLLVIVVPVSAAESDSAWVELLEYSTVDDSGSNTFKYTTSATISIPTPQYMRCCKIDMLISYTAGTCPSSVKLSYNGTLYTLTVAQIDNTLARVYGDIPDGLYANVLIQFTRSASTTSYVEVLSCRVSPISTQEVVADADCYFGGAYWDVGVSYPISGINSEHWSDEYQVRISVYDWMKYDSLTIWGSVSDGSIDSIRATIATSGLSTTVSYIDIENIGVWTEWIADSSGDTGASFETPLYGKYLYCITIDLTSVDRTLTTSPLYVYMTGVFDNAYGMTFLCQYVNGSITIPDTSSASWWTRFTLFMTDLFGADSSDADDFASDMESQATEAAGLVDDLDSVTRPPVEDIEVDLSGIVSDSDVINASSPLAALLSNNLFLSMTLISLTLALVAYVLYGKR